MDGWTDEMMDGTIDGMDDWLSFIPDRNREMANDVSERAPKYYIIIIYHYALLCCSQMPYLGFDLFC